MKEFKVTQLRPIFGTSVKQRKESYKDEWWVRRNLGVKALQDLRKGKKLDMEGMRIELVKLKGREKSEI